ncbi:hypothetical protein Pmani_015640 [Petrolisthes manimaculis]|uniref:Uncharacterized protein n=1 Tax=Petrolisthes manimaculis TaxID=1843537 RepID=A0AAE1PQK7_9EUCA|nr:hypothetical protein Pmani_015640 [Petrolisthes manimaculis]
MSRTELQVSSPGCLLLPRHVMEILMNSLHIKNQACSPALSQMGKIRLGAKSHLVGCLEELTTLRENAAAIYSPPVEVMILDGAATVNMLAPGNAKTFSDHEEAYTRILLHVQDSVMQGYIKVSISTVDTDVVVLAVAVAGYLVIDELWVAFGTGKNFRHLAAHEMAVALGTNKCRGLPFFHAFTGCDTVSCFSGREKRTAWETWKACNKVTDEVTTAFCALAATPTIPTVEDYMDQLERFVILLYDRTSSQEHANEARKHLFTRGGRSIEAIPPTREALRQHRKRAAYQAGYCWGQMMICTPELPSPSEWGWVQSDNGWGIY